MKLISLGEYVRMEQQQEQIMAPINPGTFNDLFSMRLREAFDDVITKGLKSLDGNLHSAMNDAMQWNEESKEWEAYNERAKMKMKTRTVKKTVKKVVKRTVTKKKASKAKKRSR